MELNDIKDERLRKAVGVLLGLLPETAITEITIHPTDDNCVGIVARDYTEISLMFRYGAMLVTVFYAAGHHIETVWDGQCETAIQLFKDFYIETRKRVEDLIAGDKAWWIDDSPYLISEYGIEESIIEEAQHYSNYVTVGEGIDQINLYRKDAFLSREDAVSALLSKLEEEAEAIKAKIAELQEVEE